MHAHLFAPHIEPTGPATKDAAVLDALHGTLSDALDARLVRVRVRARVMGRVRGRGKEGLGGWIRVRDGVRVRVRVSTGIRGRGSRCALERASFSRASRAAICSATLP